MSHNVGVDTIHIRDGSIGQDLGISFSLSLTIKAPVSIVSPGSKVVSSSHSISMVVGSDSTVDMVNKLSLSLSLTIEVSVSLASQMLDCGVVVSSVERSHSSVKMVNQLWVSISLSLTVMPKPDCQVVVGGCKVGIVHRGDCSTKVANKLAVRGGSKAAQDLKMKYNS